jgi:proline dehydrogenase
MGLASPVWDKIEETHSSYNDCVKMAVENARENDLVFVAGHNIDSIMRVKNMIIEKDIKDGRIVFGQLKCFSDQITGSLAQENFKVFKYLPYGPTENLMPYLVRRGQESRQVLREQTFQNEFLKREIRQRLSFSRRE